MPGIATGTAIGNVVSQEDLYLEGAPYIYFQDDRATPLNNPDAQSYDWGIVTGKQIGRAHV